MRKLTHREEQLLEDAAKWERISDDIKESQFIASILLTIGILASLWWYHL